MNSIRTEDRKQKTEDRRQKSEDKRQKTKDRLSAFYYDVKIS